MSKILGIELVTIISCMAMVVPSGVIETLITNLLKSGISLEWLIPVFGWIISIILGTIFMLSDTDNCVSK